MSLEHLLLSWYPSQTWVYQHVFRCPNPAPQASHSGAGDLDDEGGDIEEVEGATKSGEGTMVEFERGVVRPVSLFSYQESATFGAL